MVTPGSSFVQTMMGRGLQWYIPIFMEMGPPITEKKIFEGFNIYRRGGHLVHVAWTIYTNFGSFPPRRLHIKFGFDWPSGFRGEDLFKKRWTDG